MEGVLRELEQICLILLKNTFKHPKYILYEVTNNKIAPCYLNFKKIVDQRKVRMLKSNAL